MRLFPGHQQHLAGTARERGLGPAIKRLFDDQTDLAHPFGEFAGTVEADPVLALPSIARSGALPGGPDVQEAGERIKPPLLPDNGPVRC
jgi:hypothetical protein